MLELFVAELHAVNCVSDDEFQVHADCNEQFISIEPVSTEPVAEEKTIPCPDFMGTDEEQQQLQTLLNKYAHVFASGDEDLGHTDFVQHRIPTTDDVPVSLPYRSIPPNQMQEVKDHIQKLLNSKVITESQSPYSAPIVRVRKKDGSL